MIAVDVNTIACHWFISPHSNAIKELFSKDSDWVAPALWRSEFRNILANQIRFQKLALLDALEIWSGAEKMMKRKELLTNTSSVLILVAESNCSAYDCEYIAVARHFNVNLITYDKQLIKEFPDIAMTAEQYLALAK
jgi:predicted nucleic acid-binding protein